MRWNSKVPLRYVGGSALALAALLLVSPPQLSGADISYVYDNLGRVIAVIDPATDTAVYAYDAVGNLTGITRQTSSTLAIFQFTPSSGPPLGPVAPFIFRITHWQCLAGPASIKEVCMMRLRTSRR